MLQTTQGNHRERSSGAAPAPTRIASTMLACAGATMIFLAIAIAEAAAPVPGPAALPAPSPSPIQLILDTSGPPFDHAAAIEGTYGIPDPFTIENVATWINQSIDRNSRISVFVTNLALAAGETAHDVTIDLVDHDNQVFAIDAVAVLPVPGMEFAQVVFRLPDNIATGKCRITIRWHGQSTNPGTIKIRPPRPIVEIRPIQDTLYIPHNCPRTFVIKNIGPQGSTLDYSVVDTNGWIEVQNGVGSLAADTSATIKVRIHPDLLVFPDLLPTQTFIVVNTPDAANYVTFPIGYKIRDVVNVAQALIGTWSGVWSGNSFGRNNPGQPAPTTPVSGTWILNLQSVDLASNTASGTLTWNGTDAYWTYGVNGDGTGSATPHAFIPNRTITFNGGNTTLSSSGFGNCDQGHRFHLTIDGARGAPNPSDSFYGPWFSVEMNVDSGAVFTTGNGFNANPYNPLNFDTAFSNGVVTGNKTP